MGNSASVRENSRNKFDRNDPEVARWIFESLKPLRAACVENDYGFMAYLIEMTEVEAYRMMRNQSE